MENFHVPSPPLTEGIPTMGGGGGMCWNYALCKKPSGQPPTHFIIFIISFHENCTLEIDVQPQLRDNKNTGTHVKKKKHVHNKQTVLYNLLSFHFSFRLV